MRLIHGAASDVGLVRAQNEDSFVVGADLFAVCDGMGGALAGEVASETACRSLMHLGSKGNPAERLQEAVRRANAEILKLSIEQPGMAGMGTTLTAAVRQGDTLILAHVGDSRAYLLRDGALGQLTEDHSLVADLVRQGRLTREQAAVHPHRSVITRALGTDEDVEPDVVTVPLQVGDRVVLCSDGVSGLVPEDRLQQVLAAGREPQATADELVREALARGGDDNATVVVMFAIEGEEPKGQEPPQMLFGPQRRTGDQRQDQGHSSGRAPVPPAPSPPGRPAAGGRWRRLLGRRRVWLVVGVVVLLLVVGIGGLAAFNSSVYHVGADGDQVVLYRGLPATVFGIPFYTVIEVGTVSYGSLEPYLRERVDARELTTKEEGQRFLRSLDSES